MKSRPPITTKQGDDGKTRLFSGETISKNDVRTNAYGDLDELVSVLGIARSLSKESRTAEMLLKLQRLLFIAGTELATMSDKVQEIEVRIGEDHLSDIEQDLDALENDLNLEPGFVIPGGTTGAAVIDQARAIARRCERRLVGLLESGDLSNPSLLIWFNRLSDCLWLLARLEEGGETVMK